MNPTFADMPVTIFEEINAHARAAGAINLGQGFPDTIGPPELLAAAARAVTEGPNQYAPSRGLPVLRSAVAAHYRRFQALDLGDEHVIITSGATEAIAAAILAIVSPGDEVIIFEPAYDAYRPLIERAGGIARPVTLRPPDWRLPVEELARAFGPRTRAVMLNNPVNPAARVFSRAELSALADACIAHDVIAICDEVWEHVVFDGTPHVPLIRLPGMAARTVKIGSAGKIFGLTGWKIGFVMADPALLRQIANAHQFLTFASAPCLQAAVAHGLGLDDGFFAATRADLQRSRDLFVGKLRAAGFVTLPSEGTYFVSVDLAASGIAGNDRVRRMISEAGVAGIPYAPFYMTDEAPQHLARFCFAKPDEVLTAATDRLARWRTAQ